MGEDAKIILLMQEVYQPGDPARSRAAHALIRALRAKRDLCREEERIAREVALSAGDHGAEEVRRLCRLVA
ncbi:hypothetical protein J2R99_001486 [Rhodopseudomonas julia]|uniref:Uncharacterized protein n=1 Tax=Rhodopseudomonas julia TaxID=200617 RepID=A0ABU0C5X4_9BRAD|nr:hypothetical protein [Rhodopseudomonas julia]MDQ0325637.1 hypothetical protein [Rhodopseudomonas julia]